MRLNDFQILAETFRTPSANLNYSVLGLNGEAGEVADKFKKIIRDKNGVMSESDKIEIIKELGDVLWYIANTTTCLGVTFNSVAEANIKKLASRQKRNKISGSGDNR